MRLTAEQATRAAHYLQTKGSVVTSATFGATTPPSDELLSRVRATLAATPEVRPDRVSAARQMLAREMPDAESVAERILWRTIADALR